MNRCAGLCIVVAALAQTGVAEAQIVNAESLYRRNLDAGWSGQVEGTLGLQQGNVDLLDVGGGGRVQYQTLHPARAGGDARFRRHRAFAAVNGRLARRDGEDFIAQAFGHLRYTFMAHPRIGPEVFLQHQYNEFLRLQTRFLAGGGPRAILLHLPQMQVAVGSGYMFELDERSLASGSDDVRQTRHHRWNNYLSARGALFDEALLLQTTIYAQPRWDAFADVRVLFQFEAEVAVNEWLSLSSLFSDAFDSRPPEGVESLDLSLLQKVKITF